MYCFLVRKAVDEWTTVALTIEGLVNLQVVPGKLKVEVYGGGYIGLKGLYLPHFGGRNAHITITPGEDSSQWHLFHVAVEGTLLGKKSLAKKEGSKAKGNHVFYDVVDDEEVNGKYKMKVEETNKLYEYSFEKGGQYKLAKIPEVNDPLLLPLIRDDVQKIIQAFHDAAWGVEWA